MDKKILAKKIIEFSGGEKNIISVTHCLTRLRFSLKDEKKADIAALKKLPGVVKALFSGGLLQVVIGAEVSEVYSAILSVSSVKGCAEESAESKKKGVLGTFISAVTGVFVPLLPLMSATGLIKGMLMLLSALGVLSAKSGTYQILYGTSDAFFFFLPVLIGFTAARKSGASEVTGIMIGLALCSPTLTNIAPSVIDSSGEKVALGAIFGLKYYATLFGVPVIMPGSGNYTSTVVPIILIVYFSAFVEKRAQKIIPREIKSFAVPLFSFLFALSSGLIIIGPLSAIITDIIGSLIAALFSRVPILGGAIVGGFWQVLVIFGLHWSIIPLRLINLASDGFDMVLTPYFVASFACLAAAFAVAIRTRDRQTKSLALPAIISAFTGITEPALYGITLPRKRPFVFSCIASAAGGMFLSATKTYAYISGGLGVFGFSDFIMTEEYAEKAGIPLDVAGGVVRAGIGAAIAMAISFSLTMIFWRENISAEEESCESEAKSTIYSPMSGKVIALSEIEDEAFSDSGLGVGVAIEPVEGVVYSPVDGVVSVLPSTFHAACITGKNGEMVLIHIGYNTAELCGKGFSACVEEGAVVKKGDKIITFDIDAIKNAGYSLVTPVVIGNTDDYTDVQTLVSPNATVRTGDTVLVLS